MAILSAIDTSNWQITLNRVEQPPELALVAADFTAPVVTGVSGIGLTRDIVLSSSTNNLTPSNIRIANHDARPAENVSAMVVTDAITTLLAGALDQIRQLLDVGLTSTELPNAVVRSSVYLRKAELEVYQSTNLTDATYDSTIASMPLKAEQYRISTMYRTAALLIPALPDIVEQSTLRLRTRYTEIDWEKKRALFLQLSDDIIEDDIVDPQITATVVAECITKTVLY